MNRFSLVPAFLSQSLDGVLWDEAGPAAPAGGETPATPAAATPAASAPPAATSQAPAASPTPSQPPEGYVPSYRLREAREAVAREYQTRYEQEQSQIRAELEQARRQLQALTGVTPQQTTEADAIKEQFYKLFPNLRQLEERYGDIQQLMERAGDIESQTTHYWNSYGRQTMDRLYSLANESLGSPLTEEGKRQLHSAFVGFVQSSPELAERYASDPTIVEDFWRGFTNSFVTPGRRGELAAAASRAAAVGKLPQDAPSGAPQPAAAPKLNGLDERVAAAWSRFQEHKAGGQ